MLVVGAGITGALVAESLTRQGHEVVVIDRETPGRGSTNASTAMLLWEIDQSLHGLTRMYGFERAARGYRASFQAVRGLLSLVALHRLDCQMRPRPSLYLAAEESTKSLRDEHDLRQRADLPGDFLDHSLLMQRFGIARAGALLSPLSAEADPVQMTEALLDISLKRGARLIQGNAVAFDGLGRSVMVGLENGLEIEARHVVLATGYVVPDILRSTIQRPASSWAIGTEPQPHNLWPDNALIWEARQNYYYARTTTDGRIIIGGEDDDALIAPDARDAATPVKAKQLQGQLEALWPRASTKIDFAWSGTFDTTLDGLPLIGAVPGQKNIFAAYGYGGNGITFSYLAAELITRQIGGGTSVLLDDFAIDREVSSLR